MKLGAFSISLNVKDLAVSKSFYEKLGFAEFAGDEVELKTILAAISRGDRFVKLADGSQVLEQNGNPVDFLLYAVLTSGTTRGIEVDQRDYILSMELINVETGDMDKESARIRKEYVK